MADLNEFKLKKGFKELFGHTVFGSLSEQRLTDAKAQLLAHCQTVDMQAMADDVRPFLFNPREDRLVTMFPQYIQQALS